MQPLWGGAGVGLQVLLLRMHCQIIDVHVDILQSCKQAKPFCPALLLQNQGTSFTASQDSIRQSCANLRCGPCIMTIINQHALSYIYLQLHIGFGETGCQGMTCKSALLRQGAMARGGCSSEGIWALRGRLYM